MDAEQGTELPEFHSMAWSEIRGRGWSCSTLLDRERDEQGIRDLVDKPVLIDGMRYICRGVERFMHLGPWRAGELVGIIIEGLPPEKSPARGRASGGHI